MRKEGKKTMPYEPTNSETGDVITPAKLNTYEPTNWKTGDVVTSAKLNKLENAVANNVGILNVTFNYNDETGEDTIDKTFREIFTAISNGMLVISNRSETYEANTVFIIYATTVSESVSPLYTVVVAAFNHSDSGLNFYMYKTSDLDGYPVRTS